MINESTYIYYEELITIIQLECGFQSNYVVLKNSKHHKEIDHGEVA